jgi:dTDP-glucose 4,6-dehydratase
MRRVLVTGGCGFIGSHLLRHLAESGADLAVVNLDALTYAGRLENVAGIAGTGSYRLVRGDIADAAAVADAAAGCDAIINVAAETHVDRSIMAGDEFIATNILGTKRLLDWVVEHPSVRFIQVSTDEVYGDVPAPKRSLEDDPLVGSSPYAAAKAAADLLVLAYVRTYGIDACIIRGANAYGPNQYPEKLIPLMIINALRNQPMPLYGDGHQEREYTFVDDFAAGIAIVLRDGVRGEVYNCGSETSQVNAATVRRIVDLVGADPVLIRHVADRPGHDRRYALDCSKLRALGWQPRVEFDDGLRRTVRWYTDHRTWWEPIIADETYVAYREANYARRGVNT